MRVVAEVLAGVVALLHVGFLFIEMVLWTSPTGRHVFATSRAFAEQSRAMAANQGLYNGFLAAGLVWGVIAEDPVGYAFLVFFLVCVVVAGVFGAVTVSRRILVVQALPAAAALVALLLS